MSILAPKPARRTLKKRATQADAFDEYFARIHRRDDDPETRAAMRKTIDEMLRELPDDE